MIVPVNCSVNDSYYRCTIIVVIVISSLPGGHCWLRLETLWSLRRLPGCAALDHRRELCLSSAVPGAGRGLGPFSTAGLEPGLTGQEPSAEVPAQGPKALALRARPGESPVCSPRRPRTVGLAGREGHPSHPPCLLLTGGRAGDGGTRCRPSGRWRSAPAAGPPRCAAPPQAGL